MYNSLFYNGYHTSCYAYYSIIVPSIIVQYIEYSSRVLDTDCPLVQAETSTAGQSVSRSLFTVLDILDNYR